MLKFKRHLIMKLKLTHNHLGRLWISLTLVTILCVTLQIVGNLQPTRNCRCDQKLKQLVLQQTTGHENLFQQEKGTSSGHQFPEPLESGIPQNRQKKVMAKPRSAENILHITELGQTFSQTQASTLDSQDGVWKNSHGEDSEDVWILHTTKRLKSQPQVSERALKRDHMDRTVTPPPSRKPMTKAGDPFNKKPESTAEIIAKEQTSRSPFGKVAGSFQSQAEATGSPSHRRGSSSTPATTAAPAPDWVTKVEKRNEAASWSTDRESLQSKTTVPRAGGAGGDALAHSLPAISDSSHTAACKPKTHVVFLKVHKSASSTVMNILFRFGEMHNLNFALPVNGASQLGYPYYFLAESVEGFTAGNTSEFNIMCHHMRFQQVQVQRVMPSSTFYFSILRNPIHLMESSFTYYKGSSPFSHAQSLEEFLSQPARFYNASAPDSHYAKNLMAFDFGFNHNGNFSAKHMQLMLRYIEEAFDLLLLSEYFDESMVLLKEALCWDLDSIVSFPLNSRERSTRSPLSESTAEKIKSWNKLDWAIYRHFNRTFWQRIDWSMGQERMQQEVRVLRERREQLAKTCLQGGGSVGPHKLRDKSLAPLQYGKAKIQGYNLKPGLDKVMGQLCRRMVTPELQYSRFLYRRQFPEKAQRIYKPAHPPRIHNRTMG
ncbi:galactose-3-O-sulfotransferase 2-like [Trachemys scripta elegans]|uniref:galactose-3-O-sulfotransferase 2-like n=1 Tax=Trachemys scripta elegans TaxID=31138 RepID=UPI00155266DD|nr:galactose-3-O-sulfotransferase 2-like [Trachemys scripta elegans]